MEPEFITYQKFNDAALANGLTGLLEEHGIAFYIDEGLLTPNPLLALNEEVSREYAVKIDAADFERVNELLKQNARAGINETEKDYYLFDFDDDELLEIVTRADEWSAFDVQLAQKLLADRGKGLSDEAITNLQKKRIEDLKAVEPRQTWWIIVGYLFAIVGGVLGFFIGWHLYTYKKTLPDGERVYMYSEKDRLQGKLIFCLSFAGLAVAFLIRLMPAFSEN